MRWAFLDDAPTRAFAHRGGNRAAPENTLAAFEHAVGLGCRYLETDVHCTADGVLVAFHDSGLARVGSDDSQISALTWDELGQLPIIDPSSGSAHRVPKLAEVIDAFPTAKFNIDPKADAAVEPLIALIRDFGIIDRVCVGSFSDARIEHLRSALGPRLCASLGPVGLLRVLTPGFEPPAGYGVAAIPRRLGPVPTSRRLVERFQAAGLAVHVWTVNDHEEMQTFVDHGVDGITSDDIETLLRVTDPSSEAA